MISLADLAMPSDQKKKYPAGQPGFATPVSQPGFNKTGANGLGSNYGMPGGVPGATGGGLDGGQNYYQAPAAYQAPAGYGAPGTQGYGSAMAMPNTGVSTLPPSTGSYTANPPPSAGNMVKPSTYGVPGGAPGPTPSAYSGYQQPQQGYEGPTDPAHPNMRGNYDLNDPSQRAWATVDRSFQNQGNRGLTGDALQAARQQLYDERYAQYSRHQPHQQGGPRMGEDGQPMMSLGGLLGLGGGAKRFGAGGPSYEDQLKGLQTNGAYDGLPLEKQSPEQLKGNLAYVQQQLADYSSTHGPGDDPAGSFQTQRLQKRLADIQAAMNGTYQPGSSTY